MISQYFIGSFPFSSPDGTPKPEFYPLPIGVALSKTSAMKIQPRRLGFIVLAVVAILTFLNCSQRGWFGKGKDAFVLNIGNKGFLGIGDEYVPVDQGNLDKALNALSGTQAVYDIYFLDHDGGTVIPHYTPRPHTSLKTNRVIKSDVAEQMLAEASSANDPNAMHKVQSPDPGDIKTVLDAFTSTPTPTP